MTPTALFGYELAIGSGILVLALMAIPVVFAWTVVIGWVRSADATAVDAANGGEAGEVQGNQ